MRLNKAIEKLEKEEIVEFVIRINDDKEFAICNITEIAGAPVDRGFYIDIRGVRGDLKLNAGFIMEYVKQELGINGNGEKVIEECCASFEVFKEWVKNSITWILQNPDYTALRARKLMTPQNNGGRTNSGSSETAPSLGRRRTAGNAPAESHASNADVAAFISGEASTDSAQAPSDDMPF